MHPQRLDVREGTSITEAVSDIVPVHGGIGVLVNNADLGFAPAPSQTKESITSTSTRTSTI